MAGRFLYAFLADSEMDLPNDSPAQLVLGPDSAYEATVVSVQGFDVTLAVPRNLGDRIPTATLISAPYYLLEILAKRLSEAREGRLPVNRHLALALFGREPAALLPQQDAAFARAFGADPSPAQPHPDRPRRPQRQAPEPQPLPGAAARAPGQRHVARRALRGGEVGAALGLCEALLLGLGRGRGLTRGQSAAERSRPRGPHCAGRRHAAESHRVRASMPRAASHGRLVDA